MMSPEEKNALINFFGVLHAEAKHTDQQIVGQSQFVRPISNTFRQTLETALHTAAPPPPPPPAPVPQYVPIPTPELHPIPEPVIHQPVIQQSPPSTSALSPDAVNEIVSCLKEINLTLGKIAGILNKKDGTKRTKNTQPS